MKMKPLKSLYHRYLPKNEEIKQQIQYRLQKGHIRPSFSPCGSPIILVQKKYGTWWLCIDYQTLNKMTVRNWHLIPQITNLLDQLKGAKYFNKIDLKSSYQHVLAGPTNVWKTTFKSKYGLFEWLIIPSGLKITPTTFMMMMMDDIL